MQLSRGRFDYMFMQSEVVIVGQSVYLFAQQLCRTLRKDVRFLGYYDLMVMVCNFREEGLIV